MDSGLDTSCRPGMTMDTGCVLDAPAGVRAFPHSASPSVEMVHAYIAHAQIARRAILPQFCLLPRRANHHDALAHPASPRRGVARDRHDTRGGDAVDVSMLQRGCPRPPTTW